jgi:hypothetical protein
MAIPGMATGHKDTVCPVEQGLHNKQRIHTAGTWDPDDPEVGGLFKTAHPGCICSAIRAPVAEKTDYPELLGGYF